ncbi:MAG: hypothetical protein AABW59_05220 [archaeon]
MQPQLRPKKPNEFNDSMRGRKPRAIRASPWASRYMKRQRAALAEKFGSLNVGDRMRVSARLLKNPSAFSDAELVSYLETNHKQLKFVLKDNFGDRRGLKGFNKTTAQLMLDSGMKAGKMTSDTTRWLAKEVASSILKEGIESLTQVLRKNALKYLEARKIPVDNGLLEIVLADYMVKNRALAGIESSRMDVREIEASYLSLRKIKRGADLKYLQTTNKMIRAALAGLAPSNKKIAVAKRWIERNHKLYTDKFHVQVETLIENVKASTETKVFNGVKVTTVPVTGELAEKVEKLSDEMWAKEKDDLRQFVLSTMHVSKGPARLAKSSSIKKPGTREQRLAEYNPRQNVGIEEERKNTSRLASAETVARQLGREFDSVGYSLAEISKANSALGDILRGLMKRKEIQSASVEKLYTKGNLAQRAFFRAVTEFNFSERMGSTSPDSLAKVIASIGPEFPPIGKVEHSVRDGSGPKVLDFLVRSGLADNTHRGGQCVGLVRAKA